MSPIAVFVIDSCSKPVPTPAVDIEHDGCWISVSLRYWRKRASVLRHSVAMASDIKEGCPCTSVSPPDVGHIKNNGIVPKIHWHRCIMITKLKGFTGGLIAKRKRECGICGTTLRHRSNWKWCIMISFSRGCVDFVYGPGTHAVAIKYIYKNSYSAFSMQFNLTLLPAFLLKTLQNINHISSCCLNSPGKNSLMGVVVFFLFMFVVL